MGGNIIDERSQWRITHIKGDLSPPEAGSPLRYDKKKMSPTCLPVGK